MNRPGAFRCSHCRQTHIPLGDYGTLSRIRLLGRTRNHGSGRPLAREYECLDCGHLGCSQHPDLQRLEQVDRLTVRLDSQNSGRDTWFSAKSAGVKRTVLDDLYTHGYLDASACDRTPYYRLTGPYRDR